MRTYKFKFLLLSLIFLIYACGGDSDLSSGTGGNGGTTSVAASVALTATQSDINFGETSTISATVLDSNDENVPNDTVVSFSLNPSSYGSIVSQATTSSGIATATFTASNTEGTVVITATSGSGSDTVNINISSPVASISLTANPPAIPVTTGTSSISATVLDSYGANVPDGTVVSFSLNPSTYGSIASQATTSSGVATATFSASDTPGNVTITAMAGSASDTAIVTIDPADTGSIEFDSATPDVIGIKEFGHTETSLIKFLVKDINGNPVVDGTAVDFVMSGPGGGRLPADGGEYIGDQDDGTPTTASVSTVNGEANVYLHSGTVAGPVILVATVSGTTLSSASTPISIGGGVLNDDHFTVATDKFNLEGLAYVNIKANISAYLADRFGNYNVLEGTSVSFYAEAGAIDMSNVTDSTGVTSAAFRTQNPIPEDVVPEAWETTLQDYVLTKYDPFGDGTTAPSGHPRDGWATILVSTKGEEAFDDINANGMYDSGEFTPADQDTPQEAFIDINDNGSWNGTGPDPFEICIDENENYTCDGPNGVWDADKTIFKDITLLITGYPAYIEYTPTSFTILNGGSETFSVLVSDINLNPLIAGSSVSIAADKGDLSGFTSYTFPDIAPSTGADPLELSFTLTDSDDAVINTEQAIITITVTWKGIKYPRYIYGTID